MHKTIKDAQDYLNPNINLIPESPGVYRFYDIDNNLLYIGKAKNLRKRISNYLKENGVLHGRITEVLLNSERLDWVITKNEKESLILESKWIRELQPRYNIKLIDTDNLGGSVIYNNFATPKLSTWRGRKPIVGKVYGPFPGVKSKDMLSSLSEIFQVRTCKETIFNQARKLSKPCLLGEIGKCVAPCLGGDLELAHKDKMIRLEKFLKNSDYSYLDTIKSEMNIHADRDEFEKAKIKRDQLNSLKKILANQNISNEKRVNLDAIAYSTFKDIGSLTYLTVRRGDIKSIQTFSTEVDDSLNTATQFLQILSLAILDQPSIAVDNVKSIITNIKLETDQIKELSLITKIEGIKIYNPKRGLYKEILDIAISNSSQAIGNLELKRSSRIKSRINALNDLKEALGMDKIPYNIECIDISHTMGKQPVASIVTMRDGVARPQFYRKIHLPLEIGGDDYTSIKEAIYRRFTGSRCGLEGFPDLLIIDGGINQVNSAKMIYDKLSSGSDLNVKFIGLAKRLEEIFLPEQLDPIILPRNSDALILCQRIRDEAHRFAIGSHRNIRDKENLKSSFSEIKGIGEKRRKELLDHFKTVDSIYSASIDEIASIEGISYKLATSIYKALHN